MTISMQNLERLSLTEMEEFVQGSRTLNLSLEDQPAIYSFVEKLLKAQAYRRLSRGQRGMVRRFLVKVSGLSRQQITRLIAQWMKTRQVRRRSPQRPNFPRKYTAADIVLLAEVDAAHEELSGPATCHILEREFEIFGKPEYERLGGISVSHLYNLRHSETYRRRRVRVRHTQSSQVSIAERRKPDPQGQPGYLRVDTVHQGQHDGQPGIYHINAVDTVTQWEIVGCVETISERHLLPVLEAMFHQFPFRILGFHCDNGSEFINHQVAGLLNKLLVEFTKSRAYRTTDNALVEGKNGAVVRKHIGYGPIGAEHAQAMQKFFTAHLNPYLNYHRPCGFATIQRGARGKRKRVYRSEDYQTPYEKLISLDDWQQYLKEGIRAELLQQQARRMSDTEAARQMKKAKLELLGKCRGKQ
jgi:transposase InsO family protein